MAFIFHCLWKVKLKNSRMTVTNEQTHTNRNYTLHIKCKIRIIIITAEYVDGKADIDVELDFEKLEAESLKNCIICSIPCYY